jgi:rare lipoprotein A
MRNLFILCCFALLINPVFASQSGQASYYGQGDGYAWKTTASGEVMNPHAMTCASWEYPLGTRLKVTCGNRSVIVRVNDRGGYHALDLSPAAFKTLAPLSRGIIKVKIEVLHRAKAQP